MTGEEEEDNPTRYGMRTITTLKRSKSDGQHSLPDNPRHAKPGPDTIKRVYPVKKPNDCKYIKVNDFPDRHYGTAKATRFGGEEIIDVTPEYWQHGEWWNRDSLIKKWKEHEVRRNAAQYAHDVHRHDQSNPVITTEKSSYSLGLRDRQGIPTSLWWPISKFHQFRSPENYANFFNNQRSKKIPRPEKNSMFRSLSSEPAGNKNLVQGLQYGSTSLEGWDDWAHANSRECAKTSLGIHAQQNMDHPWGIPHDKLETRPGLIYSKKWKTYGPRILRDHLPRSLTADVVVQGDEESEDEEGDKKTSPKN